MKITKANGKSEYTLIENLKKRNEETDQKIVDIVSSIIEVLKRAAMMQFVNTLQGLTAAFPRKPL